MVPLNYDAGLVCCAEAIVYPGRKPLNDRALLNDCNLGEEFVIFMEGKQMSCRKRSGMCVNSRQLSTLPILKNLRQLLRKWKLLT